MKDVSSNMPMDGVVSATRRPFQVQQAAPRRTALGCLGFGQLPYGQQQGAARQAGREVTGPRTHVTHPANQQRHGPDDRVRA